MSHTLVLNADATPMSVLPLSVFKWQDAIRAIYLGTATSLHDYEDWVVRSPSIEFPVPSIIMMNEYVKVRRVVKFSKEMIFIRDAYTCQYCSVNLSYNELTLDHVVPRSHGGGKGFSNLVTSCAPCNQARGTDTRIQPREPPHRPTYFELVAKRKSLPLTIAHESWKPFLGWSDPLIEVVSPDKRICVEDIEKVFA